MKSLRSLQFVSIVDEVEDWTSLSTLTGLTKLTMMRHSSDTLLLFSDLHLPSSLQSLRIDYLGFDGKSNDWSLLGRFTSLTKLEVRATTLNPIIPSITHYLLPLSSLTTLILAFQPFTFAQLHDMNLAMPLLRSLRCKAVYSEEEKEETKTKTLSFPIPGLTSLQCLDLQRVPISKFLTQAITSLKLKRLELSHASLTEEIMTGLIPCPSLEQLTIHSCQDDKSFRLLGQWLTYSTALKTLNLSQNRGMGFGWETLQLLSALTSIQNLNLSNCDCINRLDPVLLSALLQKNEEPYKPLEFNLTSLQLLYPPLSQWTPSEPIDFKLFVASLAPFLSPGQTESINRTGPSLGVGDFDWLGIKYVTQLRLLISKLPLLRHLIVSS